MTPIRIACSLVLLTLAGCAVGPDYERPAVAVPAAFKEAGEWKVAEPKDEAPRGKWWEIYGDVQLNALVEQVAISNQNVRAAEAQYRQAVAALDATRAGLFPTLNANVSASRGQGATGATSGATTSGGPVRETDRVSLGVGWEADVWGRIRRGVESGQASAQAGVADLQGPLLSAQATLVQVYIQLRVSDAQRRLLDRNVVAYQRSLEITRNRYEAGVAGKVDVAQAETQLKSLQAQVIDVQLQRAQLEHAIAALIGKTPSEFSLAPTETLPALPAAPRALPSALLERRPDVAAAERRAAAANAEIGVAQAAFFPALTLSASGGYQSSSWAHLLSLPNRFWSIGPALALTLFDAGARSARKEGAVAGYDRAVATYRQTVLTAFQEVEDNLAALRLLADTDEIQRAAAASAAEALRLTENQYKAGTVSYLNVVSTQSASLNAERNLIEVTGRRLLASAALQKALGGGWSGLGSPSPAGRPLE